MKIYGVAILAGCYLIGQLTGSYLGVALGIGGNVGGVGFAMILLIVVNDRLRKKGKLDTTSEQGVLFWSAMYIPIVIAMSATQNVTAALTGGWVAVFAAVIGTAACFALVPLIAKIGQTKNQNQ
jgi:malonate transporter MadL subunit